ncbi:MAG: hypothetical protein H2184_15840 [Candidatus Galacturonibacter soehngenii]|nr:hypothetical protein [Candidatus Galacturonibacter soehngenii]
MERKKKKLYKPQNVPEKKYVIKGFTKFTVTWIATGLIVGLFIGIWQFVKTENVYWGFVPASILGGIPTVLLVEDQHGENFIIWIKQLFRYLFEQHQYEYKKYNIYERKFYGEEDREQ